MTTRFSTTIMTAGLLGAVASCLPPVDSGPAATPDGGGPPPGATARQLFDLNVSAILDRCGSPACHGESNTANGPFVDDVRADRYDRVVTQPKLVAGFTTGAPILSKIAAGHYGVTYQPNEGAQITTWLAKEVEERGQTRDLLREFSGCITLEDFTSANMAAWGNNESEQGLCRVCHGLGEEDFIANNNNQLFFERLVPDRIWLSKYFTPDPGNTKIIINMDKLSASGNALPPHITHPEWDSNTGPGIIALRKLYELANARIAAKTCGAPAIAE